MDLGKNVFLQIESDFKRTFNFDDNVYNYMLLSYGNTKNNDLLANILIDLNAVVYLKTRPHDTPEPVYLTVKEGSVLIKKTVNLIMLETLSLNLFTTDLTLDPVVPSDSVLFVELQNFVNIVYANVKYNNLSHEIDLSKVLHDKLGSFYKIQEHLPVVSPIENTIEDLDNFLKTLDLPPPSLLPDVLPAEQKSPENPNYTVKYLNTLKQQDLRNIFKKFSTRASKDCLPLNRFSNEKLRECILRAQENVLIPVEDLLTMEKDTMDEMDIVFPQRKVKPGSQHFFYYDGAGNCSIIPIQVSEVYPNMFATERDCLTLRSRMYSPLIPVLDSPLLQNVKQKLRTPAIVEKLSHFRTYKFTCFSGEPVENKYVYALASLLQVFQPEKAEAFVSQASTLKIVNEDIQNFLFSLCEKLDTRLFVWKYETLLDSFYLEKFTPLTTKPSDVYQNVPLCLFQYIDTYFSEDIVLVTNVEAVVPLIPVTIINADV